MATASKFKGNNALRPIAELDRAIHAPARLMILAMLSAVEAADFTFLLRQTALTRGNLSSHLLKLEEAGYIEVEKEFVERIPRTIIRLSTVGMKAVQNYCREMADIVDILGNGA